MHENKYRYRYSDRYLQPSLLSSSLLLPSSFSGGGRRKEGKGRMEEGGILMNYDLDVLLAPGTVEEKLNK